MEESARQIPGKHLLTIMKERAEKQMFARECGNDFIQVGMGRVIAVGSEE